MNRRLDMVGCWLWDNPRLVASGALLADALVVRAVEGLGAPSMKRAMVGDVLVVTVIALHAGYLAHRWAHSRGSARRLVRVGCWLWDKSRRITLGAVLLVLMLVDGAEGWDAGRTERVVFGALGLAALVACGVAYRAERRRRAQTGHGVTGRRAAWISALGWIGERTFQLDSWVDRARRRAIRELSDSEFDRLLEIRQPATSPAAPTGSDGADG